MTTPGRRLALLAACLGCVGEARSATLYVDVGSSTCSDDAGYLGAQDAATPYCSIQAAAATVQGGDLVLVAPGVYAQAQTLSLATSGSPMSPTRFRSSVSFGAIIEGPGAPGVDAVNISGNDIALDGFSIRDAGATGLTIAGLRATLSHLHVFDCGRHCDAGTNFCGRGVQVLPGGSVLADSVVAYQIGVGGNNDIGFNLEGAGSVVRNAIAADCGNGFVIYDGCNQCQVYNSLAFDTVYSGFGVVGNGPVLNADVSVFNDISVGNNIGIDLDGNGDGGVDIENDVLFANAMPFFDDLDSGFTMAATLMGDPLFRDAGQHDWHLLPGSPAIGAGTTRLVPPTDLDGCPRPSVGPVDIGPYVFGGCADAGANDGGTSDGGAGDAGAASDGGSADGAGSTPSDGGALGHRQVLTLGCSSGGAPLTPLVLALAALVAALSRARRSSRSR